MRCDVAGRKSVGNKRMTIKIDGVEIFAFRLNDGTDFLLFVLEEPTWGLCEIVLGKEVF